MKPEPHIHYDYCCKDCWATWQSDKKYKACPVCESQDLDEIKEIRAE